MTSTNESTATAQLIAQLSMLDYLGDTLPRFLLVEGFTGRQGESDSDPVARYLVDRIDGARAARCDKYMIEIIMESGYVASAYTSPTVADFMDRFDRGDFPDLVVGSESTERAA